jgi:hypothetical protein
MRPDKAKVRIANPIQAGSPFTGRNRAERYVRVGRAVWVTPNMIRFVDGDQRNLDAIGRASAAAAKYDRVANAGLANLTAVRNLPVAGNPLKVFIKTRRSPIPSRTRNSAVRVVVQDARLID